MSWAPLVAMGAGALFDKFGRRDKLRKVDTMTPGQQRVLNQLTQMLSPEGQLGQGFGESTDLMRQYLDPNSQAVKQFTEPYMRQFNEQTVPGLAERFAGSGAMGGALSSSGFGQSLGAAGGQLQSQLAALKAGLGQQAAQSLMGQYGSMQQQALGAQPFAYQQQGPSAAAGALSGWAKGGFAGGGDIWSKIQDLLVNYAPGSVI
jgi:hypothetical protein